MRLIFTFHPSLQLPFVQYQLAQLYCRFGQYEKSETLLNDVLAKPTEAVSDLLATLQSNLAVVLLRRGKEKEAAVQAREAIASAAPYHAKATHEVW